MITDINVTVFLFLSIKSIFSTSPAMIVRSIYRNKSVYIVSNLCKYCFICRELHYKILYFLRVTFILFLELVA